MKTLFYLSLWGLLTQAQTSAPVPECNVTALTRDCRIFDSAPPEIVLPDGTSFPNPRRPKTEAPAVDMNTPGPYSNEGGTGGVGNYGTVSGGGLMMDSAKVAEYNKLSSDLIQSKTRLSKALSAEKGMSEDFRMNILSDPYSTLFMSLNFDKDGKISKFPQMGNYPVQFYWPPNGKDQKYQLVSLDQLIEFLNSKGVSKQTKKSIQETIELQRKAASFYQPTNTNPATDEAQKNLQAQQEAHMRQRRAKAKELFDVAKRSFKKVFDRNASDKNAEALNQTIDNLTFKFEDEVPPDMRKSCKDGPNAYYDPPLHTFIICNSVLNYPDNQLVGIIGHEMGHSISSCSLSLGLDQVDPEMLNSMISKKSANANGQDNKQLKDLKRVLPANRAVRIGNDYVMSESFRKYAEEVKLYTPIVSKIEQENYPFAPVKECIVQNSKFRAVSKADAKKLTDKTSEVFSEKGSPFTEEDKHDLQSRNERLIECVGGVDQADETDEAMSDMWGSLAMEEYLSENPPKTDLERLSLYSFFGTNYCTDHQEKTKYNLKIRPQQLSLFQLSSIARSGHLQEQARLNQVHPPDEVRLNDVYFSLPKIADSLGCSPGKNSGCFDKLKNFARANAAAKKDSKTGGATK